MPWDPLKELLALQTVERRPAGTASGWEPPTDILETATAYLVAVELPGVTRDAIELAVAAQTLTLRGERLLPPLDPRQVLRVERGHGSFHRRFTFPEPVDSTAVEADLAEGVLTITIPKVPADPGRRVEVT